MTRTGSAWGGGGRNGGVGPPSPRVRFAPAEPVVRRERSACPAAQPRRRDAHACPHIAAQLSPREPGLQEKGESPTCSHSLRDQNAALQRNGTRGFSAGPSLREAETGSVGIQSHKRVKLSFRLSKTD